LFGAVKINRPKNCCGPSCQAETGIRLGMPWCLAVGQAVASKQAAKDEIFIRAADMPEGDLCARADEIQALLNLVRPSGVGTRVGLIFVTGWWNTCMAAAGCGASMHGWPRIFFTKQYSQAAVFHQYACGCCWMNGPRNMSLDDFQGHDGARENAKKLGRP